jgi:hypothetical protein
MGFQYYLMLQKSPQIHACRARCFMRRKGVIGLIYYFDLHRGKYILLVVEEKRGMVSSHAKINVFKPLLQSSVFIKSRI